MNTVAFVQALLAALPIVGALLLLRVADVPRARRHQQFLMPVIAAVYAVFALVVLYRFNSWLDTALDWIFGLLPFLEWIYQSQWMYLIYNLAILLVFLAVKYAYRPFARIFSGEEFIGSWALAQFYTFDSPSSRWFVKPHLGQMRLLFGVLFGTSAVICVALYVGMQLAPHWPGFIPIAFPAVAALVLGEVWAAFRGLTRSEAEDLISGEADSAERVVNYAALRDVYRQAFPDRVIDQGVDLANSHSRPSRQALDALSKSPSGTEQLFAEYFSQVKLRGEDVDENLMYAALNLLRGTSTLINSPFYADLTHYTALPTYIKLLNGSKCLIVVGRDASVEDTKEWISGGLEAISGVPELWVVDSLTGEEPADTDVGIIRAADLHNLELLGASDSFFRSVGMVLLVEPSQILATGQLGLGIVVSRLMQGETPVYAAIDHNHDGLVDALSHLLKVNLTDVVATQATLGASSELVWKTEGPALTENILPGITRYLGMGTEIGALALKYHVNEVEWIGGNQFPVIDMSWIAGQYYRQLSTFAELEASQRSITTALRPQANPFGAPRANHRFLVVEDEMYNVYETLRLYGSRSRKSAFINVLSENYLLRDYMVDNRELFVADPKAVPAIVPDYARTERNTVLRLIIMLSVFEVAEDTLLRELELSGLAPSPADVEQSDVTEPPVARLLSRLSRQYLDRHLRIRRSKESGGGFTAEASLSIDSGSEVEDVLDQLRSAYFLVEDETEQRDFIGACLYGHLQQTVLPGQFLTFDGKYYQAESIGDAEVGYEVVLRRAAEHISGRPVYRSLRSIDLLETRRAEVQVAPVAGDGIVVERLIMAFTAQTVGYLEAPSRDRLDGAKRVNLHELPPRKYREKVALRIGVPGASPQVRCTIAVLLNELFVTVFPTAHQFVTAVSSDETGSFDELLPQLVGGDDDSIYILEDSLPDLGLLIAVERNWQRLFEIVTDYLQWLHTPEPVAEDSASETVTFAGETPEEKSEREERISRAEARGSYDKPKRRTWWRRLWDRIRRRPRPQQDTAQSDEPPGTDASSPEQESVSDEAEREANQDAK